MIYVALLRGINVGGKNMVSMKALKDSFERLGFEGVQTYINSGNILFQTSETDARKIEDQIDRMLVRDYALKGKTVVRSQPEMARLVKTIAKTWRIDPQSRYNVIFLRHAIDSRKVLTQLTPDADIEEVVYCPGTLLWSARVTDLKRTMMAKLSSKAIFQEMTVRNVNTTRKILELMEATDAPIAKR